MTAWRSIPVSLPVPALLAWRPFRLAPLGRVTLIVLYAVYVVSNATALQDVLWPALRHAAYLLAAVICVAARPAKSTLCVAAAAPIAMVYALAGLNAYAVMVLAFASALPLLTIGIQSIVLQRKWGCVIAMVLISAVPALLSLAQLRTDGLFDTTYGRERMLLGYWHPKEAGVSFLIPAITAMMMVPPQWRGVLPWAVVTGFLWLVGSRNAAMLMALGYLLQRHPRKLLAGAVVALAAAVLFSAVRGDWYDLLDTLLSLRLSVWTDAMGDRPSAASVDGLEGERFGVDNFFVEAYLMAGPVALALSAAWLGVMVLAVRRASRRQTWPRTALLMLCFFASFDSGIASTGNLLHAVLWSVALSPLMQVRWRPDLWVSGVQRRMRPRLPHHTAQGDIAGVAMRQSH